MQLDSSLTALAERLPVDQRAGYLALVLRLKSLPPDDELTIALEALGFTTLILKGIPEELAELIEKTRSGLTNSQRDGLRDDIEEIVKCAIKTPSHKDLSQLVDRIEDERGRFQRESSTFYRHLLESKKWLGRRNAVLPSIANGLTAGLAGAVIVLLASFAWKLDAEKPQSHPKLPSYMSYVEKNPGATGGRVGLLEIRNEIVKTETMPDGASRFMMRMEDESGQGAD